MRWTAIGVTALVGTCLVLPARASSEMDVTIELVAYAPGGDTFCVKVHDAQRGDMLSVRRFADGKPVQDFLLEGQDEKKVMRRIARKYHITEAFALDQAAPDGSVTVVGGVPKKGAYAVTVLAGSRSGVLVRIPLLTDPESGRKATASLKQVGWTADGKWVVLVVHQDLPGPYGMRVDQVQPVKYRRWKVEWAR